MKFVGAGWPHVVRISLYGAMDDGMSNGRTVGGGHALGDALIECGALVRNADRKRLGAVQPTIRPLHQLGSDFVLA
jgi:hypothetical protein